MADEVNPMRVPIPVGGGLNDDVDPLLREAPVCNEATNLVPTYRGSLTKASGFDTITALDAKGKVVVSGLDDAIVLGFEPPKIITDGNTVENGSTGAAHPHTLDLKRIRGGRGFIHDVQLAHVNGYTMVVYNFVGDTTVYTGTNADWQIMHDFETECVLLDSDYKVVYGPETVTDVQWLPRVEAISPDGGTSGMPVFMVFGMKGDPSPSGDLSNPFVDTGNTWRSVEIDTGSSSSLSSTTIGTAVATTNYNVGADRFFKIYDTYSDTINECCYVAVPCENTGKEIRLRRYTVGAHTERVVTSVVTTLDHLAITVDVSTDTLVCYDRADTQTFYFLASTMAAETTLGLPTLVGIDSANTVLLGVHEGDRPHTPEFYRNDLGTLYLNGKPVTFTSSGPGVPSFGAELNEWLPHCYGPVVSNSRLYAFHGSYGGKYYQASRGSIVTTPTLFGASVLEMYHIESHSVGSAPTVDIPLLESRLGKHNHKLYMYPAPPLTDTENAYSEVPLITGQAAVTSGGKILVPSAFLSSVQKNRNSLDLHDTSTNHIYQLDSELVGNITDGAGYYNDEQVVGVCEISLGSEQHSSINVGSTAVVAAGQVVAWSGRDVHPIAPRAPVITGADFGTSDTSRRLQVTAVGVVDFNSNGTTPVPGRNGTYYDWDYPFEYATVMVFTDANGQEYRSAPSEWFPVPNGVADGAGEDGLPTYCPIVELEVPTHIFSFFGDNRAVDVELYATLRSRDADGALDSDQITDPQAASTAIMINRMPLQRDDVGYFIIDTLQDFLWEENQAGGAPPLNAFDKWASPAQTNGLYTASGEKANTVPPAMTIMAHSGDYIFGVPSEDDHEIWVSKPLVRGRGPEFHPELTVQAPADSGGVVSLASSYDRLYMLCRNGVWELPTLGGPDVLGAGSFPPPRKIYRGEVCIGHMGTVDTPVGTFYLTSSGPRVLANSQDLDIGRAVPERLTWENVNSSVFVPDDARVYWGTSAGGMVAYDVERQVWVESDLNALELGLLGGDLLRVDEVGAVRRQNSATYVDGEITAGSFTANWESAWLNMGDLMGDKSFQRFALLLRRDNPGTYGSLSVTVSYNYEDSVVETHTWTAAELAALGNKMLVINFSRQRAVSVKIGVFDSTEEVFDGQEKLGDYNDMRWSIVGLELLVLPENGLVKVAAGAKS